MAPGLAELQPRRTAGLRPIQLALQRPDEQHAGRARSCTSTTRCSTSASSRCRPGSRRSGRCSRKRGRPRAQRARSRLPALGADGRKRQSESRPDRPSSWSAQAAIRFRASSRATAGWRTATRATSARCSSTSAPAEPRTSSSRPTAAPSTRERSPVIRRHRHDTSERARRTSTRRPSPRPTSPRARQPVLEPRPPTTSASAAIRSTGTAPWSERSEPRRASPTRRRSQPTTTYSYQVLAMDGRATSPAHTPALR